MKRFLSIFLLSGSLLHLAVAVPTTSTDLTVPVHPDDISIVGFNSTTNSLIARDHVTGWCNINLGFVEHFPRRGSTGGRKASLFIGGVWDGGSNLLQRYAWDNGEPPRNERGIDNWTIRVYDLIRRGDSLAFSWFHPDNDNPSYEWIDFEFNGVTWNDRDTNCKRAGVRNCCGRGPWYADGPSRMLSGLNCGFACP